MEPTEPQQQMPVQDPEVTNELRRWNWGAFSFGWIWGLAHKSPITLLTIPAAFIPLGSIAAAVYMGIKGNEMALRNRQFASLDEFKIVQKIWTRWAIGSLIASLVVVPIIGILATLVITQLGGARQKAHDSSRKSDLTSIASMIEEYKNSSPSDSATSLSSQVTTLPSSLDDIKKATNATVNTVDSVTKQPYTYTTDGKSYTLKANLYSDSDCQSKVYQVVDGVSGCQ